MKQPTVFTILLLCVSSCFASAAETPAAATNTSSIDAEGTAYITRVVPIPATLSPEARAALTRPVQSILAQGTLTAAEQREKMNARQVKDAVACQQIYPAAVSDAIIGGVPVHLVTPGEIDPKKADRVLLNLHGGAFRVDAGSLLESIPIASLTKTKVVAVLYRLAPENTFPAAVDDAVAVYRELLKTYKPEKIGLYGTSAGAILTAETVIKLRQLGLPLPSVVGIFSGWGDFSKAGDSLALFSLQGLTGIPMPRGGPTLLPEYVGKTDPKDPVLSPVYADLHGLPPTLFLTSTRDALLSGTVVLHQAYLKAGVDARLAVFDALPHAFWLDPMLPESRTANELMAHFFDDHLAK